MDTTVFDYIKWRGDLPLGLAAFNEVDSVVFAMLSYLNLGGIVPADFRRNGVTLEQAAELFFSAEDSGGRSETGLIFNDDLLRLLKAASASRRYGRSRLCGFVDSTDMAAEKQFAALAALLDDGSLLVSFRGTDDSIIGWKEDFNMAFTTPVPSQQDALAYLAAAARELPGRIRLSGHSKGGNLAVFAATFCPRRVKRRVLAVHNCDGPGFEYDITRLREFREVADRIRTFIPQTSIVGMLLEHEEDYTIVRSSGTGIMQHNPFSWQLDGPRFVTLDRLSDQGLIIDRTIKDWLKRMDRAQRERFVDALFELLLSSDASTLSELAEKWKRNPAGSFRSLMALDEDTRHVVWKALQQLARAARQNLPLLSEILGRPRA